MVFFNALRVKKFREDAVVRNKTIYLALGLRPDGTRDILGLWIENTETAKLWMKVFNDLKTRGVNDILIAISIEDALALPAKTNTRDKTKMGRRERSAMPHGNW